MISGDSDAGPMVQTIRVLWAGRITKHPRCSGFYPALLNKDIGVRSAKVMKPTGTLFTWETSCAVTPDTRLEKKRGPRAKTRSPISRPSASAPFAEFSSGLRPLPPDIPEPGFLAVFGGHDVPELDVGVEGEEPRFGHRGDLRWIGEVEDQGCRSMPIPFREIDRLGPGLFQDAVHFLADGPVPDGGVERLVRHGHVHEQTHVGTSLSAMAGAGDPMRRQECRIVDVSPKVCRGMSARMALPTQSSRYIH